MVEMPPVGLGCANLMQLSLPELIEVASDHGFRRITVRPWAFTMALRAGFTESALRDRLAARAVEVTMIDALTNALPGVRSAATLDAATLALMPPDVLDPPSEETCFGAAAALGARLVNVTHYLGEPMPLPMLSNALADIARRAGRYGLRLVVEFIPGTGLPDLAVTRRVIEECGEPNVTVLLDLFHFERSGGTVDDISRLPPHAIGGIQISDRTPPPAGTAHVPLRGRLLPGDGQMAIRELVLAALDNSPAATVDIEVLNEELSALPPGLAASRLAGAVGVWRSRESM